MNTIVRFTEQVVSLAESYCADADEPAAPEGGGQFAEYAMVSLHCLRVFFDHTYAMVIDAVELMPAICREIGLEPGEVPAPSTLCKWFDRLTIDVWRVLLRHSGQLHAPSGTVAIDATYFKRDRASHHYRRRTGYTIRTLEATALVDTDTQAILDVHCTMTREGSDVDVCRRLARRNVDETAILTADKGYDSIPLRERLRELGIRPIIKHRLQAPHDYAHNARLDDDLYGQRAISETAFSVLKRTLGETLRARSWYREFRETILMCVVYNIKRAIKQ